MSSEPFQREHTNELRLLELIRSKRDQLKDNPDLILQTIDEFGIKNRLINIGPFKGAYLKNEINATNPETVVEFGSYVGYSSILIANELSKKAKNASKVYTFEFDPVFYDITSEIVSLSGLSHMIVQMDVGKVSDEACDLIDKFNIEWIDFLFIDHSKHHYLPDLRAIETLGLITEGTTIFADNVMSPGAPDYVEYVTASPNFKREYNINVKNINGDGYIGKWGLLYDSVSIVSKKGQGDVDAVEITKCTGVLD